MINVRGPVHLVGIGGMHMSAIAQLLLQQGVIVRGSDTEPSDLTAKLERMGAVVFKGHAAENLGDAQLLVTTAAAKDDNPELVEARRRGIPVVIRAEMVARLMEGKRVIAVAGSHGKTTTSSLIAYILVQAGHQPMYLLGGESIDLDGNAAWGEGDACVVEADEYKRAFHAYKPETAIITNVEADHLDYYGTPEAYAEAFLEFGRRVNRDGTTLICGDDPGAVDVANALRDEGRVVDTYGLDPGNDWQATNVVFEAAGGRFTVTRSGAEMGVLEITVPGDHAVRNALAATIACLREGVSFETITSAMPGFRGAHRRFETVGEAGGVLVMDDYAHHPTEVRATLATMRRRFPDRRIIGIHQPHTYSRIAYLWDEWATCWDGLDQLIILETYAARETPVAGRSAGDLAEAIASPRTTYAATDDEAIAQAKALARPGDVIVTIGAGDVVHVGPKLLEALR